MYLSTLTIWGGEGKGGKWGGREGRGRGIEGRGRGVGRGGEKKGGEEKEGEGRETSSAPSTALSCDCQQCPPFWSFSWEILAVRKLGALGDRAEEVASRDTNPDP